MRIKIRILNLFGSIVMLNVVMPIVVMRSENRQEKLCVPI